MPEINKRIGVMASLRADGPSFEDVQAAGLRCCQLCSWQESLWTEQRADAIRREADERGIHITSFWAGWPGPMAWNLVEGPITLGLVPAAWRGARAEALRRAGDFAKRAGLPAVITHLGFIPEAPLDPAFQDTVVAVRYVAQYLEKLDLQFWFETGQETPVTLLRLIKTVGTGNLGINLDPANLILYGKANPIDALDVFGSYVRNIHAKDAFYPTDPMKLGQEVKVGEGRVRFPEFVWRLKEIGFPGEFIIEREISGDQQRKDILATISYLQGLLEKS